MRFFSLFLAFFMAACVSKQPPQKSETVVLLFKTPRIKIYDTAIFKHYDHSLLLQVYNSGQALFELQVDEERICVDGGCQDAKKAVDDYLSTHYPPTILENILRGRPVLDERGYEKTAEGFEQNISRSGQYDIVYEVRPNHVRFRDSFNRIDIMIKGLP